MGKDLKGKDIGRGYRQRTNGKYDARFTINGQEIYLTNNNLSKLKQEVNERIKAIKKGYKLVNKNMTLDEWYYEWMRLYKSYSIKKTTLRSTNSRYKNIFGNYIGQLKLKEINSVNIQYAINSYMATEKRKTNPKDAINILKDCLDYAMANKLIKENPCILIKTPKANDLILNTRCDYLTPEYENMFLDFIRNDWYYELCYVLLNTGLRISEAMGLKWQDIDFKNKCIHVDRQLHLFYDKNKKFYYDTPKSKSGTRIIPFFNDVENVLKSQLVKVNELKLSGKISNDCEYKDAVFFNRRGNVITDNIFYKFINKKIERMRRQLKIDIKNFSPHTFRHTFCCKCFQANLNPKHVQMIMGHSSYSTTIDVYTHITKENILDAYQDIKVI